MTELGYVERIANLHIHTVASDGTATVPEIAEAAREAGIDIIVINDHNVYYPEHEGWYGGVLALVGQELNSPERPHENHLLVFGAREDLAAYVGNLQEAIDASRRAGGLPIIAHPIEHSGAWAREPEINWVDRDVTGLHGIELWNYMSEFKSYIHTLLHGLLYAYMPRLAIRGPFPETLRLWDSLLAAGQCFGYSGSDAHASLYALGPFRRRILSYRYLFSAVNTHLLLAWPWSGHCGQDGALVYDALAKGRCFVAYDRAAPATGARFTARRGDRSCTYGETLDGEGETHFSVSLPAPAEIRLVCNGKIVAEAQGSALEYATQTPGVYRFEAWRRFAGHRVGWIFGNPVWVT